VTGTVEVLCRPAAATGFALVGIGAEPVPEAADPTPALVARLERSDVGVLLLEESIYESLAPELRHRLDRSARPLVVTFPGPAWRGARTAEERVVELLRRAIGYRVRLQ
jgi:vacuolar-type H+-ATPase subunit F/Vma7